MLVGKGVRGLQVMAIAMALRWQVMAMNGLARRAGTLSGAAADLQPFGPGRRGTGSATPWWRRRRHGYAMAMLSQCVCNGRNAMAIAMAM